MPSPFDAARNLPSHQSMVLLYSGMQSQGGGTRSFLASGPEQIVEAGGFQALEAAAQQGRWFGYLGYELGRELEQLTAPSPSPIRMPELWMMRPASIQRWHNDSGQPDAEAASLPEILSLQSNFTKDSYLQTVQQTIEQIQAGAFYQANITRKFWGEFSAVPDTLALFERMCAISPAPYSAYIRTPHGDVLSSSPEGFLQMDATGKATVRPIKGSAARGATPQEDEMLFRSLEQSVKDKAENLMIVDLMRNDLSRACVAGSVQVEALQEIHRFETIFQMISTISGTRRPDATTMDVLKACFPAGSMTGAPKLAAMRWCAAQEKLARGVYSGAIGWLDAGGECDLSVVIRTLIIQGNRFEFQVGGGIVADSDHEAEWAETIIKAKGIAATLGLELARLEAL